MSGRCSSHCQNAMGSKLDQDTCYDFFHEIPAISICIILQTNGHENKTTLTEVASQAFIQDILFIK